MKFLLPSARRASTALLVVGAIFLFCATTAKAETNGLTVIGYSVNQIPPARTSSSYPECGRGWYETINQTWDATPFAQCGADRFMLHFTGYITIPSGVTSVRFAVASDDGGTVNIGGTQFGRWADQGCTISYSPRVVAQTTSPLDAWFYENGGGTCFRLYWQLNADNQNWVIVPASAFTTDISPTTTQESTTTTEEPTTTTEAPTTTEPQPTVLPEVQTTTTEIPSTTTSTTYVTTTVVPTTTSTSTTTVARTSSTSTTSTALLPPELAPRATAPIETTVPIEATVPPDGEGTNPSGGATKVPHRKKIFRMKFLGVNIVVTEEQRTTVVAVAVTQIVTIGSLQTVSVQRRK